MAQLRLAVTAALVTASVVVARPASADEPNDREPWSARPASPARASSSPPGDAPPTRPPAAAISGRRRAPDHDGRPELPEGDGAAIWTARVLLAPLWVVAEYGIRTPARGAFWVVEEVSLVGSVADELTQEPEDTIGVTPALVVELGEHPMLGVYAQIEHLVAPWERLRGVALVGGVDVMRVHVADEMRVRDDATLTLDLAALRRDDLLTWGTGPRSVESDEASYSLALVEGGARLHVRIAPRDLVSVETWTRARRARMSDGDCDDGEAVVRATWPPFRCGDPVVAAGARGGALPPGFGPSSTLAVGARFAVDAPPPRGGSSSGASVGGRVDLSAEQRARVDGPRPGGWVHWAARGAVAADLTGTGRVLAAGAQVEGVERLADDVDIPLLDLPGAQRLDGDLEGDLLLGVRPGRTVGESLAQVALDYRWPVWTIIDAQLQVGLGNAFGRNLRGFQSDLLRLGFAGGLIAPIRTDYAVRLLAGFSTDPLGDGAEPAQARVLVAAGTDL